MAHSPNRRLEKDMSIQAVDESLAQFRKTLESDGYLLSSELAKDGELVLRVDATEGACPDCLVPKTNMLRLLRVAIPDGYDRVSLRYPGEL
jgi:hypothetical protein